MFSQGPNPEASFGSLLGQRSNRDNYASFLYQFDLEELVAYDGTNDNVGTLLAHMHVSELREAIEVSNTLCTVDWGDVMAHEAEERTRRTAAFSKFLLEHNVNVPDEQIDQVMQRTHDFASFGGGHSPYNHKLPLSHLVGLLTYYHDYLSGKLRQEVIENFIELLEHVEQDPYDQNHHSPFYFTPEGRLLAGFGYEGRPWEIEITETILKGMVHQQLAPTAQVYSAYIEAGIPTGIFSAGHGTDQVRRLYDSKSNNHLQMPDFIVICQGTSPDAKGRAFESFVRRIGSSLQPNTRFVHFDDKESQHLAMESASQRLREEGFAGLEFIPILVKPAGNQQAVLINRQRGKTITANIHTEMGKHQIISALGEIGILRGGLLP